MRCLQQSRRGGGDLLSRPPVGEWGRDRDWSAFVVDPVEQLRDLADLHDRGLLSEDEFNEQKSKVLRR